MTGLILIWLGAIIGVIAIALAAYGLMPYLSEEGNVCAIRRYPTIMLPIGTISSGVGLALLILGIIIKQQIALSTGAVYLALAGALLFLPALSGLVFATIIHLKKKNMYLSKTDRYVWWFVIGFGILSLISGFMLLDGLTYLDILKFPLISGIKIGESFQIRFYALFILSGAIFVYFLCDAYVFRKYGKHGILENLFYVAFPAGIVGARIWYVIGNWKVERFNENPWKAFEMWKGGLAIMGGAVFGALAGIIFIFLRRKYLNLRWTADLVVPTILIAQAIGRWGNFFNQEVYGAIADVNNWMFLPATIREQMIIGGDFRVPLFLIESIVNLTGYFVIRYVVGRALAKWTIIGDQAASYMIWYGLTRFIMEPLRNPRYKMGAGGDWSWIWSIIFIALGILLIGANHIYNHYRKPIFYPMPQEGVILTKKMLEEKSLISDSGNNNAEGQK